MIWIRSSFSCPVLMPTNEERQASLSTPREIHIAPATEITVDPSGKRLPFFILGKGQLSHSLTMFSFECFTIPPLGGERRCVQVFPASR